jgi:hypothetical protein
MNTLSFDRKKYDLSNYTSTNHAGAWLLRPFTMVVVPTAKRVRYLTFHSTDIPVNALHSAGTASHSTRKHHTAQEAPRGTREALHSIALAGIT